MASLRRLPGSKYWIACFTLPNGTRTQRSTKIPAAGISSQRELKSIQQIIKQLFSAEMDLPADTGGTIDSREARRLAERIAAHFEDASLEARAGRLTDQQARRVISDILEKVGQQPVREETVESFMKRWLTAKERSKHTGTHTRYAGTIKLFLDGLGGKAKQSLRFITARDIEAFYAQEQAKGKAASTINTDVKTLRTAFNRARREGVIESSPADSFEFPEEERKKREAFNSEQIAKLLVAADPEWRLTIMFGYYVGARLGDAATMTMANLDFLNGVVCYTQQKTGKVIQCPMHSDLRGYLVGLKLTGKPESPLTPTLADMDVGGRSGLSRAFKDIMVKAGIADGRVEGNGKGGRSFSKLSFHALRASFVSSLAENGVEKDIRKTLAGHSSDQDHELYTKRQMGTYHEAVGKLASVWRN